MAGNILDTISKVLNLYLVQSLDEANTLGVITKTKSSVDFMKKLISKTSSCSFDGVLAEDFKKDELRTEVAMSNLVRIENFNGTNSLIYYFRVPYYRQLVINELKESGLF